MFCGLGKSKALWVGYEAGVVKVRYSNGMVTVLEVNLESWKNIGSKKKKVQQTIYRIQSPTKCCTHDTHEA